MISLTYSNINEIYNCFKYLLIIWYNLYKEIVGVGKMKLNWRKVIGNLLIFIGIITIGTVVYKKIETKIEQNKLIKTFEETMQEESPANTEEDKKTEEEVVGKAIAILEIPKIEVKAAVAEGVDLETIKYNLGHFPNTAMPGEKGNFAVAGHRIFPYAESFKDVDKLEKGDIINIAVKGNKSFTYEVSDKFIVKPTQLEVLDQTKDETMTIVTCTIGGKERLIIKGKLKT